MKASFELPDGTNVTVEGTPEEVQNLLDFYSSKGSNVGASERVNTRKNKTAQQPDSEKDLGTNDKVNLAEIVNLVKDCDEAEVIERNILDRTSQVDRALLPLYIVHEYLANAFRLTSGEISKVTNDLGIPIAQPNVSNTLSGTASRYVIGDKVKKRGQPVRYKLSRRGVSYIKDVLRGTTSGE